MADVGTVIAGRYRLVDQLAVGGMGSVWRAWDELLERPVAVKQLLTQPGLSLEDADTARMRIIREARITARLHHPNAVTLYDVVEDDRHPCLIMQYVPSKSLSTLIRENGPVGIAFATRIGAELASALATAHRVGVVHRDVKPGNVLIAEDGSAKLTDFGISHAVGDVTLTSTGVLTGTPAFLAPEVARGEDSGFPADVFSLGATLYAALEGYPPFGTDPNPMAVLHRVASGRMLPPQQTGPLTPLVTRMLSTDPLARPAMTEVGAILNARLGQNRNPSDTPDRSTFALTVREDAAPPAQRSRPDAHSAAGPTPTIAAPVPISRAADPAPADDSSSAPWPHSRRTSPDGSPLIPAPPTPPPPTTAGRPHRRRGVLLVAGAMAALVALITVVGYLATRSSSDGNAAADRTAMSAPSAASGASGPAAPPPSAAGQASNEAAPAPAPATTSPSLSAKATSERTTRQPSSTTSSAGGEKSSAATTSVTTTSRTSAPAQAGGGAGGGGAGTADGGGNDGQAEQNGPPTAAQLTAAITDYYAVMPTNTDEGWSRLTAHFQNGIAENRDYYESFWSGIDRVTAADVTGSPPDTAEATITYYFKDGRVATERTVYTLVKDGGTVKIDDSSVVSSRTS